MAKIRTSWKVDPVVMRTVMDEMSVRIHYLAELNPETHNILDLGGGTGWFARRLKEKIPGLKVYSVDLAIPWKRFEDVEYIRGNALKLPFRDGSFDAVSAHAILHHVPENLDDAMSEVERVLRPGGLFIAEEPGGENFLGNFARKHFTTEKHDPNERPLALKTMLGPIERHLEIISVEPYTYFSYVLPHISSRFPSFTLPFIRWMSKGIYSLDKSLVAGKMRDKAGYFVIIGRKRSQ